MLNNVSKRGYRWWAWTCYKDEIITIWLEVIIAGAKYRNLTDEEDDLVHI